MRELGTDKIIAFLRSCRPEREFCISARNECPIVHCVAELYECGTEELEMFGYDVIVGPRFKVIEDPYTQVERLWGEMTKFLGMEVASACLAYVKQTGIVFTAEELLYAYEAVLREQSIECLEYWKESKINQILRKAEAQRIRS